MKRATPPPEKERLGGYLDPTTAITSRQGMERLREVIGPFGETELELSSFLSSCRGVEWAANRIFIHRFETQLQRLNSFTNLLTQLVSLLSSSSSTCSCSAAATTTSSSPSQSNTNPPKTDSNTTTTTVTTNSDPSPESSVHLLDLPTEVLFCIFRHLDEDSGWSLFEEEQRRRQPEPLRALSQVCLKFRGLLLESSDLWRQLWRTRFPTSQPIDLLPSPSSSSSSSYFPSFPSATLPTSSVSQLRSVLAVFLSIDFPPSVGLPSPSPSLPPSLTSLSSCQPSLSSHSFSSSSSSSSSSSPSSSFSSTSWLAFSSPTQNHSSVQQEKRQQEYPVLQRIESEGIKARLWREMYLENRRLAERERRAPTWCPICSDFRSSSSSSSSSPSSSASSATSTSLSREIRQLVPVVYGFPHAIVVEMAKQNRLVMGGDHLVMPLTPHWTCLSCPAMWTLYPHSPFAEPLPRPTRGRRSEVENIELLEAEETSGSC